MSVTQRPIHNRHYRDVMGHLPSGVVAVAGIGPGDRPVGLVVGTFQSLSLEPPLVTFSIARTSGSWPKIQPGGRFTASVLAEGQHDVCQALSGRQDDKFATVAWSPCSIRGWRRRGTAVFSAPPCRTSGTRPTVTRYVVPSPPSTRRGAVEASPSWPIRRAWTTW